VDLGDDVPEGISALLGTIPLVEVDEGDEFQEEMDRVKEGKCMVCGTELAEFTCVLVAPVGVVGVFCSGQCLQDLNVLGWLQEQHDDIQETVKFRGGKGDVVDDDS